MPVIVNVSSLAAREPDPGFAVYAAAKAAVNTLTESLARAGREHSIRVFAVPPSRCGDEAKRAEWRQWGQEAMGA